VTKPAQQCIFLSLKEVEPILLELKDLRQAVKKAIPHVYRQQHYGRHKQDKIDAVEWMEQWGK
tara:strand:- start:669 stop:857 length:189 start_codon:yes stop_codon:yes gene_type:complete